jgi:hypothetical protein
MATIQKRIQKNGVVRYRVMIRQSDGYPQASKTYLRKKKPSTGQNWKKLVEGKDMALLTK